MATDKGGAIHHDAGLPGGMAKLVDDFDWSSTPLGARADWPAELQTFVRHILESRFPAAIVWGDGLTTIYNDSFRPILGNKPEALGRSFADVWAEVWNISVRLRNAHLLVMRLTLKTLHW